MKTVFKSDITDALQRAGLQKGDSVILPSDLGKVTVESQEAVVLDAFLPRDLGAPGRPSPLERLLPPGGVRRIPPSRHALTRRVGIHFLRLAPRGQEKSVERQRFFRFTCRSRLAVT